jgi:very-short-patch-repair endonuclease
MLRVGVSHMHHSHGKQSIDRARDLRMHMTDAERILWSKLRELKAIGYHFRRQSPFQKYFLDFVEHDAKLVIELDGSQHGLPEQAAKDATRERFLQTQGYAVLRFFNHEVMENLYRVVEHIVRELGARHPHPTIDASVDCRPPHKGEVKKGKPLPRKGVRRTV